MNIQINTQLQTVMAAVKKQPGYNEETKRDDDDFRWVDQGRLLRGGRIK